MKLQDGNTLPAVTTNGDCVCSPLEPRGFKATSPSSSTWVGVNPRPQDVFHSLTKVKGKVKGTDGERFGPPCLFPLCYKSRMRAILSCLFLLLFCSPKLILAEVSPSWTTPIAPFRIADNLYYVGSQDLASYLVVTPKGNILINRKPGYLSTADTGECGEARLSLE